MSQLWRAPPRRSQRPRQRRLRVVRRCVFSSCRCLRHAEARWRRWRQAPRDPRPRGLQACAVRELPRAIDDVPRRWRTTARLRSLPGRLARQGSARSLQRDGRDPQRSCGSGGCQCRCAPASAAADGATAVRGRAIDGVDAANTANTAANTVDTVDRDRQSVHRAAIAGAVELEVRDRRVVGGARAANAAKRAARTAQHHLAARPELAARCRRLGASRRPLSASGFPGLDGAERSEAGATVGVL